MINPVDEIILNRVMIIAEISCNHAGKLENALRLIEVAKECGADAVKFQCYTADEMTIDSDAPGFVIDDPGSLWHGRKLYDLYKEAETPREWFPALYEHAKKVGILAFSSVFSLEGVDFLESLGNPIYKISSFEAECWGLVKKCCETDRPIILSCGGITNYTVKQIDDRCELFGYHSPYFLNCSSNYPAANGHINRMKDYCLIHGETKFSGYSDHTTDSIAACMAVALGARIIEKHIRLDDWHYHKDESLKKSLGHRILPIPDKGSFSDRFCGNEDYHKSFNLPADYYFSLRPALFRSFIDDIRAAEAHMAHVEFKKPPYMRVEHEGKMIRKFSKLDVV